ncbi:MAG: glucose-1-phosphate adenylyltransferase subunit GlgD [Clostridia bacterium]|nr:glucose-1-phosphate adenylyltransferase subunit GlgD [Clostridia bacterium]
MKDVMGVVYTTKNDFSLRELTASRAVSALPAISRYRMIDFTLSSMVNSGIRNVGVIMQTNYHSLMDHLGSGKEWDLHTRNDGLFILPPFTTKENTGNYNGTLDALHSNLSYLRRSRQEYVLIIGNYSVFNTTFNDLFRDHINSGADVSLMYTKDNSDGRIGRSVLTEHSYLQLDGDGFVTDIETGSETPAYENFSMNVVLMKRQLLIHLVDQAAAHSMHDLHRDLLSPFIHQGLLKVRGFEFTGYHRRIETVESYYQFNMEMLNPKTRAEFFRNPIYTKVRDEVPAKYGVDAVAVNSLVADGCIIEGKVENSILFRGVRVRKGAVVRNSIIMQNSDVQENVEVENVILDKSVTIRAGRLIGQKKYPILIGKGVTL